MSREAVACSPCHRQVPSLKEACPPEVRTMRAGPLGSGGLALTWRVPAGEAGQGRAAGRGAAPAGAQPAAAGGVADGRRPAAQVHRVVLQHRGQEVLASASPGHGATAALPAAAGLRSVLSPSIAFAVPSRAVPFTPAGQGLAPPGSHRGSSDVQTSGARRVGREPRPLRPSSGAEMGPGWAPRLSLGAEAGSISSAGTEAPPAAPVGCCVVQWTRRRRRAYT